MRTEIIKLHQKLDTTFVYVTHDQTEAMTMGDRIVVMKGGEIQQADTPQTLYDHPCNLFVAGFIGSPQMNFMDAELGRDADGYKLTFADQSLHFAGSDALSEYVGKTVVFGIRPENLHTSGEKFTQNAAHTLTMHVDIAELMGAEIYAHCTCDGTSVTVRTPSGEPIHAGDTITAAVDMSRIHLFDKQSGRCQGCTGKNRRCMGRRDPCAGVLADRQAECTVSAVLSAGHDLRCGSSRHGALHGQYGA